MIFQRVGSARTFCKNGNLATERVSIDVMVRCGTLFGLLLVACQGAGGAHIVVESAKAPESSEPLRLEKIGFYEGSVAYFERAGTVKDKAALERLVPRPHIEGAAESVVVLSDGRASTPHMVFGTPGAPNPESERAALPSERDAIDYKALVASLEGEEIEFGPRGRRKRGRLVKVALAPPVPLPDSTDEEPKLDPSSTDDLYLLIAGEAGVERVRASEAAPLLPLDPARRALLDRAVKDARPGKEREPRALSGVKGPLRIGYVAEAAPFVASYRLLLPEQGLEARLGASALVRNETDEDWTKVAATFESTRPGPFGTRAPRPTGRPTPPPGSFAYAASELLTLPAHSSALVPFLDARVESRPCVWFSGQNTSGRRAVRVLNTTAQTFPEGDVVVFAGRFAGRATLPRLLPGGSSLLGFAEELDVKLEVRTNPVLERAEEATFDGASLTVRELEVHERLYSVENRKTESVRVEVSLGILTAVRAQGFDSLAGSDRDRTGVFEAPGKQTTARAVKLETEVTTSAAVDALSAELLREYAASPRLPGPVRAALSRAAALVERIEKNGEQLNEIDTRASEIDSEVSALRGDLAQLGNNVSAAVAPLVSRLAGLEREHDRVSERSRRLTAENARLVEAARGQLRALPKPAPNVPAGG